MVEKHLYQGYLSTEGYLVGTGQRLSIHRLKPPPFHAYVRLIPCVLDDPPLAHHMRTLRRCCAYCIFRNI